MAVLFRRFEFATYAELIAALSPVQFPASQYVAALELIPLRAKVRRNAEILLDHVHAGLKYGVLLTDEHRASLESLRLDCYEVLRQCAKVRTLRPRRERLVGPLQASYHEMVCSAIVLCQQEEPTLIDSLASALG